MQEQEDGVVIAQQLPLISNLDMKENIALIQEVHQALSREVAEKNAVELLECLGIDSVANKRKNQCSDLEQFYVMIIRAFMMTQKRIFIKTPFMLLGSVLEIEKIIQDIQKLPLEKEVFLLDVEANYHRYKECSCNMIK